MSSVGYGSPSVHSPGNMDMDRFKITLTRRIDGSFHWSPDYGSPAWIDALNFEFPDDSTIDQKLRMAVARKVREEQEQMAVLSQPLPNPPFMGDRNSSFSSGAPTLNGPAVSPLEQPIPKRLTPPMLNQRSKCTASGAGRIQKPAKKMEDHIITFATKAGGPVTKGRKGPLNEKQREDAKKSRKSKSVCADHKRSRTKCDPAKCPKNKLYTGPRTPAPPLVEGHSRSPSNASRYSQRSGIMDNSSNQSFGTSNFPQTPTAPSISHSASPSINTPLYNSNQHGVPYAVGMRYSNPQFANPAFLWQDQQYMWSPQIMDSAPSSNADQYNMGGNIFYQPNNFQPMYSNMNPLTNHYPDTMLNAHPVKSLPQDDIVFPTPDANDPVMGVPRQDSYVSHGSAQEYFTSDELPAVDPNAPLPELSPEVMRDLERIQNEFGQSHTFRSVDGKKNHTKKCWGSKKLLKFVRRVYYSDMFQRSRKPEDYGTSGTEWINVDTIEVVEGPKPGKQQKKKGKKMAKLQTVDERQENEQRQNSAARVERWANHVRPASMAAEMAKLDINDASGKDTKDRTAGATATSHERKADGLIKDQVVAEKETATTTTSTKPASSSSEAETTTTDEVVQSTKSAAEALSVTRKEAGEISRDNDDHISSSATTPETEPASKTTATVTVDITEIKSEVTNPAASDVKIRNSLSNAKKEAEVMEEVITLISAIQVQPTESKTEGIVTVQELKAGAIQV